MSTQQNAQQVLLEAAPILETQGWTQDGGYEYTPGVEPADSPLDLAAALAKAAGIDIHSLAATTYPTGALADAVTVLYRHKFGRDARSAAWALSELSDWQDEPETTLEEVLEQLRGAASLRPVGGEAAASPDRPVNQEKGPLGDYAHAVARAIRKTGLDCKAPGVGVGIEIDVPARDAVLTWHHLTGWRLHRVAEDGAQVDLRYLHGGIALRPREVAGEVGVWLWSRDWLSVEPPSYGGFTAGELDDLLGRAAMDGGAL